MEEMLHLTMAANLLNAVGGRPKLDAPSLLPQFPTYLPHSNSAFEVPLLKFSPEAVEIFLQIEQPGEHDGLPEDNHFETIGQFYEAIEVALERLAEKLGEEALFCGDPARQVTDELYYGGSGRIVTVADLESALAALEEIVEQGEGLQHQEVWDGDRDMFHPEREEVAHYFRFQEIAVGRRLARATRRSPARPASRSTSIGTPCTTCGPTRAARTTRREARPARRWRSSTTPTRACCTCWTRRSTGARACWPSRPERCTGSRSRRSS